MMIQGFAPTIEWRAALGRLFFAAVAPSMSAPTSFLGRSTAFRATPDCQSLHYDSNLAFEETEDLHDPDLRKSKFESYACSIGGPPPLMLQTDFASFQPSL
jgi:hypothetical protein